MCWLYWIRVLSLGNGPPLLHMVLVCLPITDSPQEAKHRTQGKQIYNWSRGAWKVVEAIISRVFSILPCPTVTIPCFLPSHHRILWFPRYQLLSFLLQNIELTHSFDNPPFHAYIIMLLAAKESDFIACLNHKAPLALRCQYNLFWERLYFSCRTLKWMGEPILGKFLWQGTGLPFFACL